MATGTWTAPSDRGAPPSSVTGPLYNRSVARNRDLPGAIHLHKPSFRRTIHDGFWLPSETNGSRTINKLTLSDLREREATAVVLWSHTPHRTPLSIGAGSCVKRSADMLERERERVRERGWEGANEYGYKFPSWSSRVRPSRYRWPLEKSVFPLPPLC